MKLLAVFIVYFLITIVASSYVEANEENFEVDPQTKVLCKWYASLDHEKEIAPERWTVNQNWIKSFDWYDSCLGHVKFPVAR